MNPQDNQSRTPTNPQQSVQPPVRPAWDAHTSADAPITPLQPAEASQPQGMPASLPPYTAPASTVYGTIVMNDGSKKKRIMLASVVAGAVIVLGGAAAAAYYGYVLPNKPQNLLNAALVNQFTTGKVTTSNFHGTYSAKQTGVDMTMSGSFKGAVDQKGAFDISGDFDAMVTKITFDMRSVDGKDYYFRVGGLDGLDKLLAAMGSSDESTVSTYAPIISAVNNQWFIVNQSLTKTLQPGADLSQGMKLSDADVKKLADTYKQHQFLVVQQKLKDEKIASRDSYHLKIVVDKTQLKAFAAQLKTANIENLKITNDQLKDFDTSVDNANFSKYPVDVWVSKGQKLIDQVSFTTKNSDSEFTGTVTVDDWNKAVKVTKPSGAKSLLELLGNAFGSGSNSSAESLLSGGQDDNNSGISL